MARTLGIPPDASPAVELTAPAAPEVRLAAALLALLALLAADEVLDAADEEDDEALAAPLLEMTNLPDWARMLLDSWVERTKLTWKPSPVGQPPEGAASERVAASCLVTFCSRIATWAES